MDENMKNVFFKEDEMLSEMEIFIETLLGEAFSVRCSSNDTIASIKEKIAEHQGIPASQQSLIFNYELLPNKTMLCETDIQNGSTLKLVLTVQCGPLGWSQVIPEDCTFCADISLYFDERELRGQSIILVCEKGIPKLYLCGSGPDNLHRILRIDIERKVNEHLDVEELLEIASRVNPFSLNKLTADNVAFHEKMCVLLSLFTVEDGDLNYSGSNALKQAVECDIRTKSDLNEIVDENIVDSVQKDLSTVTSNFTSDLSEKCRSLTKGDDCNGDNRTNLLNVLNNCFESKFVQEHKVHIKDPSSFQKQNVLSSFNSSCTNQDLSSSKNPFLNCSTDSTASSLDVNPLYQIMAVRSKELSVCSKGVPLSGNSTVSSQRLINLEQWIDNRPRTMPHGNISWCYGTFPENRIVNSNVPLSENYPWKKKEVTPEPVNAHFSPESMSVAQSFRTKQDSKYSVKLPAIHMEKKKPDVFCEASINSLLALKNKALHRSSIHGGIGNDSCTSVCTKCTCDKSELEVDRKLPYISVEKKRDRCAKCKRKIKTGLEVTCRCEKKFCLSHRYPEVHDCTYDYIEEGRQHIQNYNPVIRAPKLPKI